MTPKWVRLAATILTTFLAFPLSACGTSKNAAAQRITAGWPQALADFSVVWSAETGIDLVSGPAVIVRAYTESYLLADWMGDNRYLYPGFDRAVGPNDSRAARTRWLRPKITNGATPHVGTDRHHVLTITRSDRDATAIVCAYLYGAAREHTDGGYTADGIKSQEPGPAQGIDVMRITMTVPPGDAGSQALPNRGPARTPADDVFDGWRVTGYLYQYLEPGFASKLALEWPTYQSDFDACVAKAPDSPERRAFLTRPWPPHPRSDFVTLSPSPGWPAKAG